MTDDIIKGKIIVEAIKSYKNREEWTDDFIYCYFWELRGNKTKDIFVQ